MLSANNNNKHLNNHLGSPFFVVFCFLLLLSTSLTIFHLKSNESNEEKEETYSVMMIVGPKHLPIQNHHIVVNDNDGDGDNNFFLGQHMACLIFVCFVDVFF